MNALQAARVLLEQVPARWRARVYSTAATLAAAGTLLILALPQVELLAGVDVPDRPVAAFTAAVALLGALARTHTPAPPRAGRAGRVGRLPGGSGEAD